MRSGRIFWGLIAILAGVVLLMNSLGLIRVNFWAIFWPALLILAGLWFLIAPRLARDLPAGEVEKLNLPLGAIQSADVELEHGAGKLSVHALELGGELAAGSFGHGVEVDFDPRRVPAKLKIKSKIDPLIIPGMERGSYNWDLGLARNLPLNLRLTGGASDNELDLRDLQVQRLKIETGASATRVTLPAQVSFTDVEVESGAASMVIEVPQGVAARIRVESGLLSVNVDPLRFPKVGNTYESADFNTAQYRADIRIESGVGSVEVK